jgi:hypothetical protein
MSDSVTASLVRERITQTIDASGAVVQSAVIKHFADIEIARRTKLIVDGLTRLTATETDFAKIKPDHIIFGDDGRPIQQGWSGAQKSKRDKTGALVERLRTALDLAVGGAEFKKLEEVLKEGGSVKQDNTKE